ncbi:MAG TPA: 4-hydroxy-3-methylbut-2-enyl diphosphate reductase, partial [Chitinophagaceae bacterium]|nr:4-hydroxy-3-methylbut-2-enyl diphosphate reductase [Chitinophagaceae bacterium]
TKEDIVIIPAFGTTLETEAILRSKGIQTEKYNTTCPFVEKVWNRSESIAGKDYTIVIHGKPAHEETRATFSHAASNAPSVVVKNMEEAKQLAKYITGETAAENFYTEFAGQYSNGFDVNKDLKRIGVVNQTTMLASDTQAIADLLKQVITAKYPNTESFADTRDTLCYATNDNQTAVTGMLDTDADLAIVVGGYNSSNTSHLVELCEEKLPTYFVKNADNILSQNEISHFDLHTKTEKVSVDYLPGTKPVKVLITSGASCPDAIVESVINRLTAFFEVNDKMNKMIEEFSE